MTFDKNKDCSYPKFECFKHVKLFLICVKLWPVNFAINRKYSKQIYDNSNYYASLVIFQTYKNVILKYVHSFGWFHKWRKDMKHFFIGSHLINYGCQLNCCVYYQPTKPHEPFLVSNQFIFQFLPWGTNNTYTCTFFTLVNKASSWLYLS
jgi:hypothetical protein